MAGLVVRVATGEGAGRALMERAERWITGQGCSVIRLWSSSTRTALHRFYEKLGYTNIKTQYSFGKSVNSKSSSVLEALIPRVDIE